MVAKREAYSRLSIYYKEYITNRSADFVALDNEYPQIEQVLTWLAGQIDHQNSTDFLDLMRQLLSFFENRSLNNIILKYVNPCLNAAQRVGQNPTWIHINAYQANWRIGEWDDAYSQILQAIQASSRLNRKDYGIALKFLGSLQLNRGNYRDALNTFAEAKKIYRDIGDSTEEASIKAEEAAYYLNKADYKTAYALYSEIRDFELAENKQISDHILLMMGVVSRRLKNFETAIFYLDQLLQRAQANNLKGAYATAAHHMAWAYFDLDQFSQAKEFGELASATYDEIGDPRGASDTDEQLGLVAMATRLYEESRYLLERSATIRHKLGNQQGYASSLRRLAKLSFIQGKFVSALCYLSKSLYIYKKIGMLPLKRVSKIVFDIFTQRISS